MENIAGIENLTNNEPTTTSAPAKRVAKKAAAKPVKKTTKKAAVKKTPTAKAVKKAEAVKVKTVGDFLRARNRIK